MGADSLLDYQQDDILAKKASYHVFFDCVSNQSFFKVHSVLKPGGVHIKTTPDLFSAVGQLFRWAKLKRPDHIMVKPSHDDLQILRKWVDSAQLKPLIERIIPMSEVTTAHQLSEAGHVVGKLVLDMQSTNQHDQPN